MRTEGFRRVKGGHRARRFIGHDGREYIVQVYVHRGGFRGWYSYEVRDLTQPENRQVVDAKTLLWRERTLRSAIARGIDEAQRYLPRSP